jgi:hypothetical protein
MIVNHRIVTSAFSHVFVYEGLHDDYHRPTSAGGMRFGNFHGSVLDGSLTSGRTLLEQEA